MPSRLLIVDPLPQSRETVERVLTGMGHFATTVSTFQEAKQRLVLAPPDLLVTVVKLGAYNGIQLVLRATPGTSSVVIDDGYDPVLEKEATSAGAIYLTRAAVNEGALVPVVDRLLRDAATQPPAAPRRWPRKHADMRVAVSGDTAKVVEVSYGGLRLEMAGAPDEALSTIAAVSIPTVGVVAIHPVWARAAAGGAHRWWCGAEIHVSDEQGGNVWRRFVDSLT